MRRNKNFVKMCQPLFKPVTNVSNKLITLTEKIQQELSTQLLYKVYTAESSFFEYLNS